MLPLDLIKKLRSVSPGMANQVMSLALPQIIPLSGGLGMKVEEVSSTRAVASLPLKRKTRNHVGSMYFGAQMTLAELTMGLLAFDLYPPGPYGMLVKRVEADFHQKAKTAIRAVCEPGGEVMAAIAQGLHGPEKKAEGWMPVQLLAKDGSLVTEARFLAAFKRF